MAGRLVAEDNKQAQAAVPKQSMEEGLEPHIMADGDKTDSITEWIRENPGKTVDDITAKANDWREPSRQSEERYLIAIRQWLHTMEPLQREKARKILHEAHPVLHRLRVAIRETKSQLVSLSFDRSTSPDTLPRLGQELQRLRKALAGELKKVDERLRVEAGVRMDTQTWDGFWIFPAEQHN